MLGEGSDQSPVSTGMWKAADGHFPCTSAWVASKESAFVGTSITRHTQDHKEDGHSETMAPGTRCCFGLKFCVVAICPLAQWGIKYHVLGNRWHNAQQKGNEGEALYSSSLPKTLEGIMQWIRAPKMLGYCAGTAAHSTPVTNNHSGW